MKRPQLIIERSGLFSSLQDLGRWGYQSFGISASGAMDVASMTIANALVGNAPGVAVIELTALGLAARLTGGRAQLATAGADMPLRINGQLVDGWRNHEIADGDYLEIGAARNGLRTYLAMAGGFAVEPTLGSLSTHSRTGIGGFAGRALQSGDHIPLNGAEGRESCELPVERRPDWSGPVRVVLGPQDDFFTPTGVATFLSSDYQLSDKVDRMGAQLNGPGIEHAKGFNIVSDGIMNGSVQIPGHGRPLILLADRQTTGGYPKIATVIGPDLRRVGQRRPGDIIRFRKVSPEEAGEAVQLDARQLADMLAAIRSPLPLGASVSAETLMTNNLVSGVWSDLEVLPDRESKT